jgi:hypothetical protein
MMLGGDSREGEVVGEAPLSEVQDHQTQGRYIRGL